MTTELLPQVRPAELYPAPAFDRKRISELVNAGLFYGILGLGVLIPLLFALYGLLFR